MKNISFQNEETYWSGEEVITLVDYLRKKGFSKGFKSDSLHAYEQGLMGSVIRVQLDFYFSIESATYEGYICDGDSFYFPDRVTVSFIGVESAYCSYVSNIDDLDEVLKECESIIFDEY